MPSNARRSRQRSNKRRSASTRERNRVASKQQKKQQQQQHQQQQQQQPQQQQQRPKSSQNSEINHNHFGDEELSAHDFPSLSSKDVRQKYLQEQAAGKNGADQEPSSVGSLSCPLSFCSCFPL